MIKLDIMSDPICPWCYIGKTQLDRALAANPDHPFTIEWHPFQLNPSMPAEGMDRRAYLEGKFGSKAAAVEVYGNIERQAQALGLPINFAAIKRTPNTINAHRLIHWAGLEQKQQLLIDALFDAYFCNGIDIGDLGALRDIAIKAGLQRDVTTQLLNSDSDISMIKERDSHSRKMGVNAVPTFIVANQHAVPGSQTPEVWASIIAELQTQLAD
ncbi:MAG: DsbA family oxidoreductase [Planktomarina sp.]|mgnify:FL=1|nr:DsbA family oxidoreductase [Planktomarina sp.]HAJ84840.1 polyketide biosynthesis protein [Paracoccaceae bacterium]|tara:strand:+ start:8410 stop:9048 length:639 start_codon:yes stop_codon:yes gene_type:complete